MRNNTEILGIIILSIVAISEVAQNVNYGELDIVGAIPRFLSLNE